MALLLFATNAKAETLRVTQATDFWYRFDDTSVISIRTYEARGYWSDPHLWLYNSDNVLIAANDDWYGLQSRIQVEVQPGWYRLRAGVCCGNPDNWWQGVQYDLETNASAVVPTTQAATSTTSPTTTEPPTTTTELATSTTDSSTVTTWLDTTTTSTEPPTSEPSTTQNLPTSSITTTTQPDPTTTTSTSNPATSTEPSTTTTEIPSSSSELPVQSSSTSVMPSSSSAVSSTSLTTSSLARTTTSRPSIPEPLTVTLRPTATTASSTTGVTGAGPTTTQEPPGTTEAPSPQTEGERASEAIVEALTGTQDPEQVAQAIDDIAQSLDTLTAAQLDKIVQVVNQAPTDVKKDFESKVNIFSPGFDNYVPADQNVTVAQRRALVAVGAIMAAGPILVRKK